MKAFQLDAGLEYARTTRHWRWSMVGERTCMPHHSRKHRLHAHGDRFAGRADANFAHYSPPQATVTPNAGTPNPIPVRPQPLWRARGQRRGHLLGETGAGLARDRGCQDRGPGPRPVGGLRAGACRRGGPAWLESPAVGRACRSRGQFGQGRPRALTPGLQPEFRQLDTLGGLQQTPGERRPDNAEEELHRALKRCPSPIGRDRHPAKQSWSSTSGFYTARGVVARGCTSSLRVRRRIRGAVGLDAEQVPSVDLTAHEEQNCAMTPPRRRKSA